MGSLLVEFSCFSVWHSIMRASAAAKTRISKTATQQNHNPNTSLNTAHCQVKEGSAATAVALKAQLAHLMMAT
jgi:hypothetical protein